MKRLWFVLPALVGLALLGGCSTGRAPVTLPPGWIYQNTKAPLSTDFHKSPVATKTGQATVTHIHLWPIVWGLSFSWMEHEGLDQAMKNAQISSLSYADYEIMNVLGVYTRFTVSAYGN